MKKAWEPSVGLVLKKKKRREHVIPYAIKLLFNSERCNSVGALRCQDETSGKRPTATTRKKKNSYKQKTTKTVGRGE